MRKHWKGFKKGIREQIHVRSVREKKLSAYNKLQFLLSPVGPLQHNGFSFFILYIAKHGTENQTHGKKDRVAPIPSCYLQEQSCKIAVDMQLECEHQGGSTASPPEAHWGAYSRDHHPTITASTAYRERYHTVTQEPMMNKEASENHQHQKIPFCRR